MYVNFPLKKMQSTDKLLILISISFLNIHREMMFPKVKREKSNAY